MSIEEAQLQWQQDSPQSTAFDDIYFNPADGLAETQYVFLQQAGLSQLIADDAARAQQEKCVIGETGFGTGLNFFATWELWSREATPEQELHYISVEKYPLSVAEIRRAMSHWPQFTAMVEEFCALYPLRRSGHYTLTLAGGGVHVHLLFDDIIPALQKLEAQCDLWYMDGFSPAKNPDMWSEEVCREIARHSKVGTRISTFTCAGFVRRGLQACGFTMEKYPGFAGKRTMLRGVFAQKAPAALSEPWFQRESAIHTRAQGRNASELIIIGAGLAGTALADRCARGNMQVALYDGNGIASAASGNHAGMYQPSLAADDSPYAEYYFSAWQIFYRRLQALASDGFSAWDNCAVNHLLIHPRDQQRAEKLCAVYAQSDRWARIIQGPGAMQGSTAEMLQIINAGIVSPKDLCHAYADHKQIQQHQQAIQRIEYRKGIWYVFDANDRCCGEAPLCVIASAYESMQFSQCASLRMQAVRGQLCTLNALPADQLDGENDGLHSVLSADAYITPALNGHHVVGATFQRDDFDLALRQQDQDLLMERAHTMWPEIPQPERLQGRCSLRASGPDRMPHVGQVIDEAYYEKSYAAIKHGKNHAVFPPAEYHRGLFVSTAHGSRGIVGSVLAAEILYAMITSAPLPISLPVYKAIHPGRFVIKELSRR